MGEDAEIMQRADMVWLLSEYLLIKPLGLPKRSRLMEPQGVIVRLLDRRLDHCVQG
jgi:hypothetical protein